MHQLSYSYQYISSFHTFHIEIEQKYNNMVQTPFAVREKTTLSWNVVLFSIMLITSYCICSALNSFKFCQIYISNDAISNFHRKINYFHKKNTVVINIVIMHSGTTWNAKHNYFHGSFHGYIHRPFHEYFHGFFHGSLINSFWCSIANPKNGKAYICNDLNLLKIICASALILAQNFRKLRFLRSWCCVFLMSLIWTFHKQDSYDHVIDVQFYFVVFPIMICFTL